MSDRLLKALLVMLLIAAPSLAQTAAELRHKYGEPERLSPKSSQILVERYMVRGSITMTAKFAGSSARACELRIEPRRTRTQNSKRVDVMSEFESEQVIKELAPDDARGRLIKSSNAEFGCSTVRFGDYERVMIAVTSRCEAQGGGTYFVKIRWKDTVCEQIDRQASMAVVNGNSVN
ncbi:MAG TPA: hypothetical protein VM911_13795 [Pyrinomonadaceae bacterium]|jgi:hypothetical protein|nr:hypothetical protein [Pyrinomonadaceae bacterium]